MGRMGIMGAMDYLLPLPVSLPSGRVGEGLYFGLTNTLMGQPDSCQFSRILFSRKRL